MKESESNICQIAAIKEGRIVLSESYHGYFKEDCCHIASATKSIVGLLVGIAVDQGKIGHIDDKVLSYFPEYTPKRGEKTIQNVTIRHLLTMRAPYKGKLWLSDPQDIATPGYGLCMSAEEMCRIGQLCLQKGVYNRRVRSHR